MTLGGGAAVLLVSVSAVALIVPHLLGMSAPFRIAALVAAMLLGLPLSIRIVWQSDTESLSTISKLESERVELYERSRVAEQVLLQSRVQFEAINRTYSSAKAAYESAEAEHQRRIDGLINSQWQGMTGIDFENFLASVFREHGLSVQTTKVSGDQGVDLIVSKSGRMIAIQAKGYPCSTVGNKAIQEVHTGMTFYDCQAAVAITNSKFTAAARKLAAKVGCVLVDGDRLPDWIAGDIKL
jgi:HJR/Mrr/RecB family endonuclease